MYNDKYIKTKIKFFNNRVYTNFRHNKIPKDNEYCACLSVTLLDSIFINSDEEYYSQILLEECKYSIKKIVNTINEEQNNQKLPFDRKINNARFKNQIFQSLSPDQNISS